VHRRSNTNAKEKGKQPADVDVDPVVMEGDRRSYSPSCSPPIVKQTYSLTPSDTPRGSIDKTLEREGNIQAAPHQPTPQPATARKRLRPNRNQGILQAVQAYLGSHSNTTGLDRQKRPVGVQPSVMVEVTEREDKNQLVVTADSECHVPTPSLLARLPDPQPPPPSAIAIDTADESRIVDIDSAPPKPRLSAPEIMARTRARLARLKNEALAGVSTSESDLIQNGHGPANEGTLRTSSNDNVRARLVRGLEEDKRLIAAPAQSSAHPAASSAADGNLNSGTRSDSEVAEVKLRMQALLRVRLAAAKRLAGEPHSGVSVGNEGRINGAREDVNGEFRSREDSLRTRLWERRS